MISVCGSFVGALKSRQIHDFLYFFTQLDEMIDRSVKRKNKAKS